MSIQVTKDKNALACLRRTMQKAWWGDSNAARYAQPPTILNGEFVTAVNAANSAVVNIIGVDTSNNIVLGTGETLQTATVSLSSAQIITLNSVPVALVTAPGAGKAVMVNRLIFEMTRTVTAFTGGGAVGPVYHGATGVITANSVPAATITTAGAASVTNVLAGTTAATAVLANTGVDLLAAAADFAAGTGTAKVIIYYSIVTL